MTRLQLIPPPESPFAPKGRRIIPMPQDLAEHRPVMPYDDDGGEFAEQLSEVHRAAAALVHDPLRDVALAVLALDYGQKRQVAAGLRTSMTRLTTWASLVLEVGR